MPKYPITNGIMMGIVRKIIIRRVMGMGIIKSRIGIRKII
jgi:hypothetical protein